MTSPRHPALSKHRVRWLCLALLASVIGPTLQAQTPPTARAPARAKAPVTVNFVNADIEAVTRAFAAMIDRQIAVDPRVKGSITVYSEQPQSVPEAYQGFLSALRGLGFAVVDNGGLLKVVPEADAKLQTSTVSVGEVATRGDVVITQIFALRYENPNNLVAVLRPLISANNTINANPASNSLVITDYAENLQRIGKIIAALDQPSATEIEIVPLQHVVASDIAQLVQRLSEGGGPAVPGVLAAGSSTVLAEPRSNSLLIRAPNAARLAVIKNTIAKLDRPSQSNTGGGMWVVHLKNADAVRLATVLRAAFPGSAGGGSTGGGSTTPTTTLPNAQTGIGSQLGSNAGSASPQATAPIATAAQVSTGGFIQADPATNSLIITAAEPLYRQVRGMIDQLDTRRAQVYIESIIVEVSGDNAADFGLQWQGLLGQSGDKVGLFAGTNLATTTQQSIVGLSTAIATGSATGATLSQGLNIGLLRNYGGVYALAAIAQLLQKQNNVNIMSTPNLITLDNEEAKIVVGSNVPFVTGQFTNTGTGTTSPFQTIERKDVGITLRIRPQIGEGGAVRMTIFQESSDVIAQAAGTGSAGPTTTKRSIESNVVVDDGQIIVLGGLIQDRFEESRSKVPLLGDLPGIGALFRSEGRQRVRSNLMVFLRPVVMRDGDSANRLSLDRYEQIRGQQKDVQPTPSVVMPINEAPVLPPMRAPSSPGAAASPTFNPPAKPSTP